ncbi:CDP-alcohol phosphatidyltransferase family protein [Streptomyces sp. 549]|uniref:CDP-alcohol phosphatidyltransferase family protein n=1 Tax=Streptomyces sp. 549 TaxID=3049076 RepID=UPI0024C2BA48|nr:CDP-alcohol phosphatidyltransferase family protein [Streptomyces sp. 549]MDK1476865.1 CDP-alcohol phosphatidyltransferase family protein [Streptomyces sp. 549]
MTLNNTYESRLLRPETLAGAGAQLALLMLLDVTAGLGAAGWLAGAVFTAVTWSLLTRALHAASSPGPFGPANAVTLARTVLIGGVTALVVESFASGPPSVALVALTSVALILDAVDGRVARGTGTESALGARFDMEADAFLILVLCVHVAASLGAWVLLIGAMRYVFVAAARPLPWLNGPLPPSMARKAVAALQGVVLLVAASGALPLVASGLLVLGALASLVWSFGRDIHGLWRVRDRAADPVPHTGRAADPVAGTSRSRVAAA